MPKKAKSRSSSKSRSRSGSRSSTASIYNNYLKYRAYRWKRTKNTKDFQKADRIKDYEEQYKADFQKLRQRSGLSKSRSKARTKQKARKTSGKKTAVKRALTTYQKFVKTEWVQARKQAKFKNKDGGYKSKDIIRAISTRWNAHKNGDTKPAW